MHDIFPGSKNLSDCLNNVYRSDQQLLPAINSNIDNLFYSDTRSVLTETCSPKTEKLITAADCKYCINNFGAVYTPSVLAEWVAKELYRHLPKKGTIRVLDPACGNGSLLKSVLAISDQTLELIGVDIDQEALNQVSKELPDNTILYKTDSLAPRDNFSATEAWRAMLGNKPISGIIANPPWGANILRTRAELKALGYQLANGQFDSYDLFVELCLSIASDKSVLAFILPDSIFHPEHQALREILLNNTQILSISRLGEGFFPSVYRGTVVVIVRKGRPSSKHTITCMRLNKEWRQKILSRESSFQQAQSVLSHPVRQIRLKNDAYKRFDIDVREEEEVVLVKMSKAQEPWSRWLVSGRGIELSKNGKILECPQCKTAYPYPRKANPLYTCRFCKHSFLTETASHKLITRVIQQPEDGWYPLIAGEDVDRYKCIPTRQIRLEIPGINYKDIEEFKQRKLLIRKTGLGIKAAIDETGAYTNQVVFHYYVRPEINAPSFILDYLQGVLCSRVLLAYYLKRVGENEWRSHPYLTQRIVSELPIPDIKENSWKWSQALAIADAVESRRKVNSSSGHEDLMVERLVAGLYGLTQNECNWVLDVLDKAEPLEPIRTLRLTKQDDLAPIRVI